MNLNVAHPELLPLLALAVLPFIARGYRLQPYPALGDDLADPVSQAIEIGLRVAAATSIAALVLGLANLRLEGGTIERSGEGAHIVILVDRSASMDNSFAGRPPSGEEESKSATARRLLSAFVENREHDHFGVAAFSTSPIHVLPLTAEKEAVLAAIEAIDRPGLAFTDVGRGLAMAVDIHNADATAAPRAILLVSDGAAVIDRKVQDSLRKALARRPVNLYWLFLRTEGSKGIFYQPAPDEVDSPTRLPERHLHKLFQTLGVSYRAFQAENPKAIADAIEEIDKLERRVIRYTEEIPQTDLTPWAYLAATLGLLALVAAKALEVPGLTAGRTTFLPVQFVEGGRRQ